jgi:beta-lactamase regulating signal transducer with metallopeptidase domain
LNQVVFIPNGKIEGLFTWWDGSKFIDAFICDAKTISIIIFSIWIIAVLSFITWQFILYVRLKINLKSFSFTQDEYILNMVKMNKLFFRITKDVPIILADGKLLKVINCPSVIGLRKPIMILHIEQWISLNDNEKNAVITHELFHIKNNDNLKNFFLLFLQVIYWFNPLVWIALKQLRQDLETKRDCSIIEYLGENDKQAYANAIYHIALMNCRKYSIRPHSGMLCSSGVGLRLELISAKNRKSLFVDMILGLFVIFVLMLIFHKYHLDIIQFYYLTN